MEIQRTFILKANMDFLCKNTTNPLEVLTILTAFEVITDDESDTIITLGTDYAKFAKLYRRIIARISEETTWGHLITALNESNNSHIVQKLEESEKNDVEDKQHKTSFKNPSQCSTVASFGGNSATFTGGIGEIYEKSITVAGSIQSFYYE